MAPIWSTGKQCITNEFPYKTTESKRDLKYHAADIYALIVIDFTPTMKIKPYGRLNWPRTASRATSPTPITPQF